MARDATPFQEGDMFFFGCGREVGHYLFDRHMRHIYQVGPWRGENLDGVYTPGRLESREDETAVRLTQVDGWTLIGMWDRSVDRRPNSNATFLAPGLLAASSMWDIAKVAFPSIVARLKAAPTTIDEADPVAKALANAYMRGWFDRADGLVPRSSYVATAARANLNGDGS